jgi:hypothetical protein
VISAPDYYQPDFSAGEIQLIHELTDETARLYAYG